MKIAYLIMAHNTPNHAYKLIQRLNSHHSKIFLHIDKKSDIRPFTRVEEDFGNVCFIPERVSVFWGDFSGVQATINLMKNALTDPVKFDYLVLLSGSDYPVRSKDYIEAYLKRSKGKEFIGGITMPNQRVSKPISRLTSYRFQRQYNFSLYLKLVDALNEAALKLGFQRNYKRFLGHLQPYAGSQWWALSAHACLYILQFMEDNPEIVKFFKNTILPDESFFHTIIGNSPFKSNMARNLTMAHWQPSSPSPATLDRPLLETFRGRAPLVEEGLYGRGEVLFLRKFPDQSGHLVSFIDREMADQN
jgi:hypothetical protein